MFKRLDSRQNHGMTLEPVCTEVDHAGAAFELLEQFVWRVRKTQKIVRPPHHLFRNFGSIGPQGFAPHFLYLGNQFARSTTG